MTRPTVRPIRWSTGINPPGYTWNLITLGIARYYPERITNRSPAFAKMVRAITGA